MDRPVGVVEAADIISAALAGGEPRLRQAFRRAQVIPEQTRVLDLIALFRREVEHFAVIVDEYGTTQGVVTSTDILESIAGDLPREGSSTEPPYVRRDDGSWLVDGLMPIDEFEDLVGVRGLRGNGFETVGGFVINHLARLPQAGDRIEQNGLTLEVVDMDGRRVDKLLVTRNADSAMGSMAEPR